MFEASLKSLPSLVKIFYSVLLKKPFPQPATQPSRSILSPFSDLRTLFQSLSTDVRAEDGLEANQRYTVMEQLLYGSDDDQPLDLSVKRDVDTQGHFSDADCGDCLSESSDDGHEVGEEIPVSAFFRPSEQSFALMGSSIRLRSRHTPVLWQFLLMCLNDEQCNPALIEWVSKENAVFRLTNASILAKLWGQVKGRTKMNVDHLKRSLRSYYAKNILRRIDGPLNTYQFVI
ncbi:unnamed protein product [Mesocestoides corti]|uniref:ETS domain-containing protein n=1 Tax=Mesocestoides corti TaxID=53468 RepID=A0A0R3U7E3_MESCO|nr:unnamed protein product [Mesocestoides corti]